MRVLPVRSFVVDFVGVDSAIGLSRSIPLDPTASEDVAVSGGKAASLDVQRTRGDPLGGVDASGHDRVSFNLFDGIEKKDKGIGANRFFCRYIKIC